MADVRTPPRVLATSDCERCRPGLVTQPANTVSSLAYVAAGAAVLVEARRLPATAHPGAAAVGWSLVAVGAGSVAYHGPGGGVGRWLHDASLLAMTGLVALSDVHAARGTSPSQGQVAAVAALAGVAAHPRASGAAQAATAASALGAEIHRNLPGGATDRQTRQTRQDRRGGAVAAALFASGLALHVAGRTGRPLCRPDSLLQAHAAWHVLSAAALWLRTRPSRAG